MLEKKKVLVADENTVKFLGSINNTVDVEVMESETQLRTCDLFLTHSEYDDEYIEKILMAKSAGVCTALLPDGIFEWRNSFEHPPRIYSGLGQEVWSGIVSDYFLAFGVYQKALIRALSPHTKVKVIGVPRFDEMTGLYDKRKISKITKKNVTILVCSSRTPGFCQYDSSAFVDCCQDIREYFSNIGDSLGVNIQLKWRVTEKYAVEIGLSEKEANSGAGDLATMLDESDVIFCSPSTLILEAMLMKKPVVLFDYTGGPVSVACAWNIFCKKHIEMVAEDVLLMREERFKFQESTLLNHIYFSEVSASKNLLSFISGEPFDEGKTHSVDDFSNTSLLVENNYLRNRLNRVEMHCLDRLDAMHDLLNRERSYDDRSLKGSLKLPFGWSLKRKND